MSDYDTWYNKEKHELWAHLRTEHGRALAAYKEKWKALEAAHTRALEEYSKLTKERMNHDTAEHDKAIAAKAQETDKVLSAKASDLAKVLSSKAAAQQLELDMEKKLAASQTKQSEEQLSFGKEILKAATKEIGSMFNRWMKFNEDSNDKSDWLLPGAQLLSAGFDAPRWSSTTGQIFSYTTANKHDLFDPTPNLVYHVPDQLYVLGPLMDCKSSISAVTREYTTFQDIQQEEADSNSDTWDASVGYDGGEGSAKVSVEVGGSKAMTSMALTQRQESKAGYGKMEHSVTKAVAFKVLVDKPLLAPTFVDDLDDLITGLRGGGKQLAAEKFIAIYGTHWVSAASLGGEITQDMFFKKDWVDSHSSNQMAKTADNAFNVGISGSYAGFSGSANYANANAQSESNTKSEESSLTAETQTSNVQFYGGIPNSDYQAWCESVTTKPAIISPALSPIHYFLDTKNLPVEAFPVIEEEGADKDAPVKRKTLKSPPTAADKTSFMPFWGKMYWCNRHGTVVDFAAEKISCTCDTDFGFYGGNCQYRKLDEAKGDCKKSRCSGNGACWTNGGCVCDKGKRGESCDQDDIEAKLAASAASAAKELGWFKFTGKDMFTTSKSKVGAKGPLYSKPFSCADYFTVGVEYRLSTIQVTEAEERLMGGISVTSIVTAYQARKPSTKPPPAPAASSGDSDAPVVEATPAPPEKLPDLLCVSWPGNKQQEVMTLNGNVLHTSHTLKTKTDSDPYYAPPKTYSLDLTEGEILTSVTVLWAKTYTALIDEPIIWQVLDMTTNKGQTKSMTLTRGPNTVPKAAGCGAAGSPHECHRATLTVDKNFVPVGFSGFSQEKLGVQQLQFLEVREDVSV